MNFGNNNPPRKRCRLSDKSQAAAFLSSIPLFNHHHQIQRLHSTSIPSTPLSHSFHIRNSNSRSATININKSTATATANTSKRLTVTLPVPLGISLTEVVKDGRERVVVTSVRDGSQANGLVQTGDVITYISTNPVKSLTSFVHHINELDKITLVIERSIACMNNKNSTKVERNSDEIVMKSSAVYDYDMSLKPSGIYAEQNKVLNKLILNYSTKRKVNDLFASTDLNLLLNTASDIIVKRSLLITSSKSIPLIFSILSKLKNSSVPLSTKFYNILMVNLIKCGHSPLAIDVFCDLDTSSTIKPNIQCYTTLAKAYAMLHRSDDAISLISTMRSHGIIPNIRTYNAIITSCVRDGQLLKARKLFSEMLVDKVRPNVVSWNIIIDWYVRENKGVNRLKHALTAFEDMKASGVNPDVITFTTVMKAYARSGYLNKAEEVFVEMKRTMPGQIDASVYNTLLYAYAGKLDWRRCIELLDEMIDSNDNDNDNDNDSDMIGFIEKNVGDMSSEFGARRVPIHSRTFSRRRPWLENDDDNEHDSNNVLGGMMETTKVAVPNIKTYSLVIKACSGAGRMVLARKTFERSMEHGFYPPCSQTIVILLNGYGRKGELGNCFELLKSLKRWNVSLDIRMMSTVMNGCLISERPELALSIHNKMNVEDTITSTLLLQTYGDLKRFDEMFHVLQTMETHFQVKGRRNKHMEPTIVTYNKVIEICTNNYRFDMALIGLQTLLNKRSFGIKINRQTLECVVLSILPEMKDIERGMRTEERKRNNGVQDVIDSSKKLDFLTNVLSILRKGHAVPNGLLYRGMLTLCAKCESWAFAQQLVKERIEGRFLMSRRDSIHVRVLEDEVRSRHVHEEAAIRAK